MSAQRNLENSCYLTPSQLVMKEMWEIYLLLFYEQALFPHCSLFNWQGMVSKWRLLLERSCRKWRLVRKYPTMCCLLGCPGSQALEEVNLHYRTLLTAFFYWSVWTGLISGIPPKSCFIFLVTYFTYSQSHM